MPATGFGLALDRERLELGRRRTACSSGRARRRSRRSGPAAALAIRRAARFTASPITVYVRRYERPDVAGENRAAMDADADRDRQVGIDDRAQREQHALLVVAGRSGRAGGQDQLAAVGVDVGGEERDLLRLGRRLDDATSRCRASAAASAPSRSISASMPSKRMKATVTGRCSDAPPPPSDVRAHRRRQAARERVVRRRSAAASAAASPVPPRLARAAARPVPWRAPRHARGSSAAVSGLTRISPASATCSIATTRLHAGPGGSELEVRRRRPRRNGTRRSARPATCAA